MIERRYNVGVPLGDKALEALCETDPIYRPIVEGEEGDYIPRSQEEMAEIQILARKEYMKRHFSHIDEDVTESMKRYTRRLSDLEHAFLENDEQRRDQVDGISREDYIDVGDAVAQYGNIRTPLGKKRFVEQFLAKHFLQNSSLYFDVCAFYELAAEQNLPDKAAAFEFKKALGENVSDFVEKQKIHITEVPESSMDRWIDFASVLPDDKEVGTYVIDILSSFLEKERDPESFMKALSFLTYQYAASYTNPYRIRFLHTFFSKEIDNPSGSFIDKYLGALFSKEDAVVAEAIHAEFAVRIMEHCAKLYRDKASTEESLSLMRTAAQKLSEEAERIIETRETEVDAARLRGDRPKKFKKIKRRKGPPSRAQGIAVEMAKTDVSPRIRGMWAVLEHTIRPEIDHRGEYSFPRALSQDIRYTGELSRITTEAKINIPISLGSEQEEVSFFDGEELRILPIDKPDFLKMSQKVVHSEGGYEQADELMFETFSNTLDIWGNEKLKKLEERISKLKQDIRSNLKYLVNPRGDKIIVEDAVLNKAGLKSVTFKRTDGGGYFDLDVDVEVGRFTISCQLKNDDMHSFALFSKRNGRGISISRRTEAIISEIVLSQLRSLLCENIPVRAGDGNIDPQKEHGKIKTRRAHFRKLPAGSGYTEAQRKKVLAETDDEIDLAQVNTQLQLDPDDGQKTFVTEGVWETLDSSGNILPPLERSVIDQSKIGTLAS